MKHERRGEPGSDPALANPSGVGDSCSAFRGFRFAPPTAIHGRTALRFNPLGETILILLVAGFLPACQSSGSNDGNTPSALPPRSHPISSPSSLPVSDKKQMPASQDSKSKPRTILVKEWQLREWGVNGTSTRHLMDRNGDGMVDYETTGEGSCDLGVYKEDNDFDGFYERSYEMGGVDPRVENDRRIHERVPRLHPYERPVKITQVSRETPPVDN